VAHFPAVTPGSTSPAYSINPQNASVAFGLCDINNGMPEMREQNLLELAERASKYSLTLKVMPIEKPYPISVYANAALQEHAITTDEDDLSEVATRMFLNTIDLTAPKNKGPDAPPEKRLTP
jgi:hypothetical protein